MGAPGIRTGSYFNCAICNKEFYRTPGQIKAGSTRCCSRVCLGVFHSGEGNPFWGREHSKETKKRVSQSRKGKCLGNTNAKGYRHTAEAKKRISEASKRLWTEQQDKMLSSRARGERSLFHKPPELRRYRKQFTPRQRREWTEDSCSFCGATEHLELDHIVPIFDAGINHRNNAQTLCRGCNLWKTHFVDLPRYNAALAIKGDQH